MTSHEEVSVVVPHFGDPGPTRDLVSSLAGQDGARLQIIVVDDASPDPMPEVPRARLVRREVNGGFGAAVNTGAALAEHPWLLLLNSDLQIGRTFVADLLREAAPWQPAVVSPRVLDGAGREAWTGRAFPTVGHQVVEWLTPLARYRERPGWHLRVGHDAAAHSHREATVVDWVVGAAMLLPTSAFREVGGFDERFYMNVEEVDLQRRLKARGVRSVVLPDPVVVHLVGGSTASDSRRRWLVESRLKYAEKWDGPAGVARLRGSLAAATAVNLAVNSVRRLGRRDVRPLATARDEMRLLRGGRPGKVDP